jgi:hypothetical protein
MDITEIDYEIFSLPKKEIKILDKYIFKDKQFKYSYKGVKKIRLLSNNYLDYFYEFVSSNKSSPI